MAKVKIEKREIVIASRATRSLYNFIARQCENRGISPSMYVYELIKAEKERLSKKSKAK